MLTYKRVSYRHACVHLIGMYLIYESSLRAGPGWREFLYRHQGCFEASDCGRLGRQAAGHPWSALRVVRKLPKDYLTAKVLLEAKAAALHPERYQSLLSKLSTKREGEAGKEAQAMGLASQSDRRKKEGRTGDRQEDRQ